MIRARHKLCDSQVSKRKVYLKVFSIVYLLLISFDLNQRNADWDMKFQVGNETIDCSGPGTRLPLSAATCYKKQKHINVNQVIENLCQLTLTLNIRVSMISS